MMAEIWLDTISNIKTQYWKQRNQEKRQMLLFAC